MQSDEMNDRDTDLQWLKLMTFEIQNLPKQIEKTKENESFST